MEERSEIEAEIERTRGELVHKAHLLEARVVEVKERVGDVLDLRTQYRKRPWQFVLASIATGVVTAWSLSGDSNEG